MRGVSGSRLKFSLHRKTTAALACLVLTGCIGQKPSFPKLTSKSSSKSSANQLADPFNMAEANDSQPLTHVSLNETASLGPESSLTNSPILATSAESSLSGQAQVGHLQPDFAREMNEIDAAFLHVQKSESATPVDTRSLEQFKGNVANVQQGGSHLEALKASLNDLNVHPGNPTQTSSASLLISEHSQSSVSETLNSSPTDFLAETPVSLQAPAYPAADGVLSDSPVSLSDAEHVSPGVTTSDEFPWSGGAASASISGESVTDRVRGMLMKSHLLVQQNNLMAARTVAESAQALLHKTQQVLSPGEVTPEQVLADIKSRQQQYEQRRAQAGKSPVVSAQESLPVMIDLSREWVNTPAHRVQIASKDDLETFAEATVVANKPASLPLITPREVVFDKTSDGSHQLSPGSVLSEKRAETRANQVLSVSQALPETVTSSEGVVLLGEMPVQNSAPPVMTGGGEPASVQESLISFGDDRQSPTLSVPALDGPLLVMPESSPQPATESQTENNLSGPVFVTDASGSTPAASLDSGAELDEFAADFAQVTQASSPGEFELAPLMIDELELQSPVAKKSWMSASTMCLMIGGVVAGAMLLFRWRR